MNVASGFDFSKTHPVVFAAESGCNTTDEVLVSQVETNIRRGISQAQPHTVNDTVALLVCGGPSLEETLPELVQEVWKGGKIIAVNGAYKWCIEHNLKPSAAVMLDAREFNARFFEEPVPGCKYFLASQCHPQAFELCAGRETYIWHAIGTGSEEELAVLEKYYFHKNNFFPVTIGTTVAIRTLSLMRMMGFQFFDIFGLDSCWLNNKHHAYSQTENNNDGCIPVWLRPGNHDDKAARFLCAPWHMKQAQDFQSLIKERGDLFQLNVRGNGLIATMIRTGAEIETSATKQGV